MARLVLPAGAKAEDLSWIERNGKPITWAQVAHENGVEIADDRWLTDNGVTRDSGYGVRSETPPVPPLDPSNQGRTLQDVAAQLDALTAKLQERAVLTKQDSDEIAIVKAAEAVEIEVP